MPNLESFEIATYAYNFEPEPFVEIPDQPDLTRLAAFLTQNGQTLKVRLSPGRPALALVELT